MPQHDPRTRPSRRLALATYPGFPDLWREDRRLIPAFAQHGIRAEPAVWSNAAVEWHAYDAVLIRSCWDYYSDYPAFIRLLDTLDAADVRVFNPSDVIRWNTDKRYLLDLEAAGAPVMPTAILPRDSAHKIESLAASRGWSRLVVKPTVSANGHETHALNLPLDANDSDTLNAMLSRGPVLVQPFAPEIRETGEYSFIFIDGSFSHAVLKRPRQGEFRVQVEYGGTVEPFDAPDWVIDQAAQALAAARRATLYARVDGIVRDGRFLLMELELAEPNLYFEFAPEAASRLAAAVARELVEWFFPLATP
jgi:glutathione synthase/RimK-type ligase-like ATP-grasp enzyme